MTYSNIIRSAAATLVILGAAGNVQADGSKVGQAMAIDLGDVSGVAYYTAEDRGYHVVVTLDSNTSQNPVRFESVLAADQSVIVSAPRGLNVEARTVALTRKGDGIVVTANHTARAY